MATIAGAATLLVEPVELTLDPAGRLYTANFNGRSIVGFDFGAAGNTVPAVDIAGSATGLASPVGVAVSPPAPLALATAALPVAHFGSAYSTRLTATGGVPPYKFALVSGTLPAGLALSPAGAINGTPATTTSAVLTFRVTDSAAPAAGSATRSLSLTVLPTEGQSLIYAANAGGDSVTEYAPGATGNVAPVTTIAGAATGLINPEAIAVSSARRIYVAVYGDSSSIAEFAPGASGNAAPAATIEGAATGLDGPLGVVLDAGGDLWVSNSVTSTVTEYAPGATGNIAPIASLAGAATGLSDPDKLTFDAAGHLWVSNFITNTVLEYAAGAHGNAAPISTLSSSAIFEPHGLAFDQFGRLHLAKASNQILEFAAGATGNATPLSTIGGTATMLNTPDGVALDPAGRLYAASYLAQAILGFNIDAQGNSAPAVAITGSATGLNYPIGVAVSPPAPLAISTASLPGGAAGAPYAASLTASGGVPAYRWALTAGSLPPGLSLSSAGAVTGTPMASGTSTFTVRVSDSGLPTIRSATRTVSIAITIAPGVYAANLTSNTITEHLLSTTGDAAPALVIGGPDTGLNTPDSVILDATGRTYVANSSGNTVTEYPVGATGDVNPVATITGVSSPRALALDSRGDLFVGTTAGPIYEYAPGASGAATPIATIGGQNNPEGLGFDASGNLYVSEQVTNSINEYALSSGAATLTNTIVGPDTGLASPQSLVVDPTGHLTVANAAGGSVTIYAPGATGDASPVATLTNGLQNPTGVDRGTDLTVFVGDAGFNAIVEYGPGDAFPSASISGPDTGLGVPISVAATPPLSIITTTLPRARQDRTYLVNLEAGEGTTPYQWQLAGGRLPRGLRLTPDGAITGVPRGQRRRYRFTVEVADAGQPAQSATQTLTLVVRRHHGHGA